MAKKSKSKKQPKIAGGFNSVLAEKKKIKTAVDINQYKNETPVWQLGNIDHDGKWGWQKIGRDRWQTKVLPKLCNYESMTWNEIESASGGRNQGTNNHFIKTDDLIKDAQERLTQLHMDDLDELFSLRLEGKHRIFGKRIGRIMQIIWFDFEHEICASKKKNT